MPAAQDTYRIKLSSPEAIVPNEAGKPLFDIDGQITHSPLVLSSVLGREQQPAYSNFRLRLESGAASLSGRPDVQIWSGGYQIGKSNEAKFLPEFRIGAGVPMSGRLLKVETPVRAGNAPRILKLALRNLTISGGPANFSGVTISGHLEYRSDLRVWSITQPLVFSYESHGQRHTDTLTGTISTERSNDWTTSGRGEHRFNLRFNADRQSREEDYFKDNHKTVDEAAFFDEDAEDVYLAGAISFRESHDTVKDSVHDTGSEANNHPSIVQSSLAVALKGVNLSPEQLVNFTKLWLLLLPETYALAPFE